MFNIEYFFEVSLILIFKCWLQYIKSKKFAIYNADCWPSRYLESISSLINILSTHNKRDDLIIKFDYLINYYKSGVHLTALYKYNNKIFLELAFIFENSSKLTNLIYKNHFLIESLVYFFNYGIPTFKLREFSDNFDLDLKKSIQDIYEILFLLDYLLLSKKITNTRNNKKYIIRCFHIFFHYNKNYKWKIQPLSKFS